MFESNLRNIILFAVIIISLTIWYWKKNKKAKLGLLILILYSVTAISAVLYYGIFGIQTGFNKITLFPYMFWIVCFGISFLPLYWLEKKKNIKITYDKNLLIHFGFVCLFISIIPFCELLPQVVSSYSSSVFYESISDIHDDNINMTHTSVIGHMCLVVVEFLYNIAFVTLWPLIKEKGNKLAIGGVIILIATYNLPLIANVSRNTLFNLFIAIVVSYVLYSSLFENENKQKRMILISGGAIISSIILIFTTITLSRSDAYMDKDRNATTDLFVLRYMGESTLNFNQYVFSSNGYGDGDMFFTVPKTLMGMDTRKIDRGYFYGYLSRKTGIPLNIFYSYIGDLCIDVGPYFALLFLVFISALLYILIIRNKRSELPTSSMLIVFVYTYILASGFIGYQFKGSNGWMLFTVCVVFIFLRVWEQYNRLKKS